MSVSPSRRTNALMQSLLCLLLIMMGSLMFSADLDTTMDVRAADETIYLRKGFELLRVGLESPEWGPLYQVWYFALSQLVPDPLDLYYVNYRVLMLLLPCSFFCF